MPNPMNSIVSHDEVNSLLKGDFSRKAEIAPIPRQPMNATPSRSSKSVVTPLELRFLMSGPGNLFETNA
ncbi:hypothetical protein [Desulfovibrio inopinatus]|uniref:hypothetical protein n=1 Tax=Desulfovibrio inopinatus TaxID=102109 RepID=UPI0004225281|nr:hypothetical protein [Desulfovibrio inopinatus]